MVADIEQVPKLLADELAMLWRAHAAVGLKGFMQLYTREDQVPFRAKQSGVSFWFGPDDNEAAIAEVIKYYNSGHLPNTPLLLNPIVHKKEGDSYAPIGSGFAWCTALSLGIDVLNDESADRLQEIGALTGPFERGDNDRAGLKVLAITTEIQPPTGEGKTVIGCQELYELANIKSDQYTGYYLLSGISYLSNNGLFQHPDFGMLFRGKTDVKELAINAQNIIDAAYCWNAYDRHHSLYLKFGRDTADVEQNLRFFNLVARDVTLFDATGPMRKEAEAMFEFIVPGWIPRGAVTLLAASGGTGKSSLAHQLCVLAAIDYKKGEEAPKWLGQRLSIEKCQGISIYFSGEDGPPIINARAAVFDPKGRAKRLMFQRTDFGEGMNFSQHLKRLYKIPEVPIMVIDPARKYLTGDEEDSGVVSEFFEAIEEFAINKHAAVVVVHHLQKNAYPKSARETLDMLRGSQVFIDRPRVVIGMFRDGPYTIAGLAKNNIPPNMGMVTEERVFARDPQHLSLIWMPGERGVRNALLSEEELEALAEEAKKEGRI